MATFKEILRQDVGNVFMNTEEFAALHNVNGKRIPVVVDENELIEREKRAKSRMDGIYVRATLIYVKATDIGALPPVGSALTLDGRTYRVIDAVNESGLYSIHLEANRS